MDLLAETIVLSCPECCIEAVKPRLEEQGLSLSERNPADTGRSIVGVR